MFTNFNYKAEVIKINRSACLRFCLIFILLFYSCEKEIFVESKSSDQISYCTAYISSNPNGAQVYIDGRYSGHTTPDTIKWLSQGEHNVRLRFNSVLDTVFKMQTDYSTLRSVYVDYFATFKNYGHIYCETVPKGSSIYLNKILTPQFTPDTLKFLLPGDYEVKYYQFGFRSDSSKVKVTGGTVSTLKITMQDTSEWIDYRMENSAILSDKIVTFKVDKSNNIWIGTYDCGLSKFTYGKFTNYYTANSGLPDNFITCLEIDRNNNVWIGTMNGLAKFNGVTWKTFYMESGLPSNYITALYSDVEGTTYVGTKKGLVQISENYGITGLMNYSPLLSKAISTITGKNDGTLWIASEGGVTSFVNGQWKTFTRANDGLLGFDADYIAIDSNGIVWCSFPANYAYGVGIAGGLMKYDGNTWSEFPLSSYVKGSIQRIVPDVRGNLWLASPIGIILLAPDNSLMYFAGRKYAMVTNNGTDILIDKRNKVWFALWNGGIVKCKLKLL